MRSRSVDKDPQGLARLSPLVRRIVEAMAQVNVHEAKSQLSALIARVLAGEEVTIARAGVPVVDLVPHRDVAIVYGLGRDEPAHDPGVFDGVDDEVAGLFYGKPS